MARKTEVDYDRLEPDWRAGIKSPAMMAEEYTKATGKKVTGHGIVKHFKKEGIERDLTAKIRAKADSLVTKKLVTKLVTRGTNFTDTEIINAAAEDQANIVNRQQERVDDGLQIVDSMVYELKHQTANKELYEQLGELIHAKDEKGLDKLNEIYHKVISFGGRTDNVKKLTDTLKTLIELQRKIHKIDDNSSDVGIEDFLRKMRNV